MAKRVISLRLSEDQICEIDLVCRKLRMNRSEAISAAVALLNKHVGGNEKMVHRDDYLDIPWMADDDKN